jgi:hypothetical protein
MARSKEEIEQGRIALRAEEAATKKKWCALEGHRWDLPAVSPFNHDIFVCEIICNRCNAHADLSVVVRNEMPAAKR